jgi:hypothetical protein
LDRSRNISTNEHEKEYFIKHDTNNFSSLQIVRGIFSSIPFSVVRGEKLDWTRRRNLSTNEHEKEYFIKHDTNNSFLIKIVRGLFSSINFCLVRGENIDYIGKNLIHE